MAGSFRANRVWSCGSGGGDDAVYEVDFGGVTGSVREPRRGLQKRLRTSGVLQPTWTFLFYQDFRACVFDIVAAAS